MSKIQDMVNALREETEQQVFLCSMAGLNKTALFIMALYNSYIEALIEVQRRQIEEAGPEG